MRPDLELGRPSSWVLFSWGLGCLFLLGCAGKVEPGRTGRERLPPLVAQSVTATVQREASRLVRLEIGHESILTTPAHPFATPGSGWTAAGRLAPGDWVVSERFGAVRIRSVRSESAVRPVPVFNLSVASSHAYFVGSDRVLVHNTVCKPDETRETAIERMIREREAMNREIAFLEATAPASIRLGELRILRKKLQKKLDYLREAQRREQGVSRTERAWRESETESEIARKALEAARNELAELENLSPSSAAERIALAARKAALERQVASLELSSDREDRIVHVLRELMQLEKEIPTTEAERRALEERRGELTNTLRLEKKRRSAVNTARRKRSDPEKWREHVRYRSALRHRLLRSAAYVADTERPHDSLESLQAEVDGLLQQPPSEGRDARIHHVTEQLDTMKQLVEARRGYYRIIQRRVWTQGARKKLVEKGKSTGEVDRKLEQLAQLFHASRIQIAQLRVRERLLVQLGRTPWPEAPVPADEARLHEFERTLREGIALGPGSEEQLIDIERTLDATEPNPYAHGRDAVLGEAYDVNEILGEREQLRQRSPSPERAAGFESSYEQLRQELREERAALEGAVSALVDESAAIQATQASSSAGLTWEQRLRVIQEEQIALRAQWRVRLRERAARARQELQLLQSIERFRDEAVEAELAREIALLERELQRSSW